MKSLFRNLEIKRRETCIREALVSELLTGVKSVQYEHVHDKYGEESIGSLLTVLEGIFIHGLTESFKDRMSSILGGPDQRPSPEFWTVLMIFSHREIIKQIHQLSQITTDIGRSRAWIRLALNENLLVSYLSMINQDTSALSPHYRRYAYLRDTEILSMTINSLQGISHVKFSLPINSTVLNTWPNAPLLLAGVWTPPLKDVPVSLGTDIVQGIVENVETVSIESFPSTSSRFDDEEVLKRILGTPVDGSPLQSQFLYEESLSSSDSNKALEIPTITYEQVLATTCFEKEIVEQLKDGEASGEQIEAEAVEEETTEPSDITTADDVNLVKPYEEETKHVTLESYDKVVDSYGVDVTEIKKPDLQEIIDKFGPNKEAPKSKEKNSEALARIKSVALDDYEVIEEPSVNQKIPEFKFLMEQLGKLMHERGLIEQSFNCKGCEILIGVSFFKAHVCSLTGCYFCDNCFKPADSILPAKVLHNWDFSLYQVSGMAAEFLKEINDFPLFDIRKMNKRLYLFSEMDCLQKLRLKLNFIRTYLFTCHTQIKEQVKRLLWPREYLYEHVHLYAMSDLVDLANGKLADLLNRAIKLSVNHILECQLCSQKGFICEVCPDKRVIYPFDIDTTYRCPDCRTVYHRNCKKDECRKCKRIKERKALIEASSNV